jgi:hypothetical protein
VFTQGSTTNFVTPIPDIIKPPKSTYNLGPFLKTPETLVGQILKFSIIDLEFPARRVL